MQCYIPVGVLQGTNNIQTFTVTLYRIKTKLKVDQPSSSRLGFLSIHEVEIIEMLD